MRAKNRRPPPSPPVRAPTVLRTSCSAPSCCLLPPPPPPPCFALALPPLVPPFPFRPNQPTPPPPPLATTHIDQQQNLTILLILHYIKSITLFWPPLDQVWPVRQSTTPRPFCPAATMLSITGGSSAGHPPSHYYLKVLSIGACADYSSSKHTSPPPLPSTTCVLFRSPPSVVTTL